MASTPYHGGEKIEMQMRQHEKSGLSDTSYNEDETTPLLERTGSITDLQNESALRQKLKKSVDLIKSKFPMQTLKKLKSEEAPGIMWGKLLL